MDTKLALQIITTIGYYKDGASSTPCSIKEIWHKVFREKELPRFHQNTFMGQDSWINWDAAKLALYEAAINYLSDKIDN